jgi:peptidoglycan/LPS O-acetylase OafA/YrhL
MSGTPGQHPQDRPLAPAALRLADFARHGLILLVVACVVTAGAAALVGRKGYFGADGWPLFYGVFGAAAALVTGLLAALLGGVLRRPTLDEDGDPSNVSPDDADV